MKTNKVHFAKGTAGVPVPAGATHRHGHEAANFCVLVDSEDQILAGYYARNVGAAVLIDEIPAADLAEVQALLDFRKKVMGQAIENPMRYSIAPYGRRLYVPDVDAEEHVRLLAARREMPRSMTKWGREFQDHHWTSGRLPLNGQWQVAEPDFRGWVALPMSH